MITPRHAVTEILQRVQQSAGLS